MSSDNPKTRDTLSVGDRVWVGGSQRPGFGAVKSISPSRDSAELTMDSGGRFIVWTYSVVPILTPGDTCDDPPHPGRYCDDNGDVLHVVSTPTGLRCWWVDYGQRGSVWEWGDDLTAEFGDLTYIGPLDAEQVEAETKTPAERLRGMAKDHRRDAEVEGDCWHEDADIMESGAEAIDTLAAIRDALGCDVGSEVEAIRARVLPASEIATLRTAARRLDEVCDALGCDEAAVVELAQRLADDEHRTLGDDRWTPQEVARALRALADDMDGEGAIAVTDAALSFALGEVTRG